MMCKSSKIASNSPPKCLKPVSNPYMMPKYDLAHFSETGKKIDFLKIFSDHASTKFPENAIFP